VKQATHLGTVIELKFDTGMQCCGSRIRPIFV
jgi:hypothetical protein